jgi:uncharacterized protein (TIGR02246 family)
MELAQKLRAEQECTAVTTRFFHCLDRRDDAGVAALLTEDGVWVRQGKRLEGPAAVLQTLQARPAGRTTRHLVANIVVDLVTAHEAAVAYEVSVYPQQDGETVRLSAIMTGVDRLLRTDAGWRIGHKEAQPLFSFRD